MITIVVAEPGKPARIQLIENELKPLQELVGGYIEIAARYPAEDGVLELDIFCNEDGLRLELRPNRVLETGQLLVGTIIAVKGDPTTGEQVTLTPSEAEAIVMQLDEGMVIPFEPTATGVEA